MKTQIKTSSAFTRTELLVTLAIIVVLSAVLIPAMQRTKARSAFLNCGNHLKQIGVAFRLTNGDIIGRTLKIMLDDPVASTPNEADLRAVIDGAPSPYTYQILGVLSNDLHAPDLVSCPADRRETPSTLKMATNNSTDTSKLLNQNVSYFVAREVPTAAPQRIQCGDRNLGSGNTGPNSDYGYSPDPHVNTGFAKELGTNNATVQWTKKMHKRIGNILFSDGHVERLSTDQFRDALKTSGDPAQTDTAGNFILFP